MSLAAYVAGDGLVGHQWEEGTLVLRREYAPVQGNARARKWEWVVENRELGKDIGNLGGGN